MIVNNIAIDEYMNFIISVMLAAGVVFELPMVSWFLSQVRHSHAGHSCATTGGIRSSSIFILAAFLTPGTDPVSQVLLALPLIALYELSIGVSAWAWRGRKKKDTVTTDSP